MSHPQARSSSPAPSQAAEGPEPHDAPDPGARAPAGDEAADELRLRLPDPAATYLVGAALGRGLAPGDLLGLDGPLGAGKTSLVQGLAVGLGVPPEVPVQSPTFTLLHQYPGRVPLHHGDLYRIERPAELDELGLWELAESGGVLVVEWLSRFPQALGPDRLQADLSIVAGPEGPGGGRALRLRATGPRSRARLRALRERLQAALEPGQGQGGDR